MRHLRIAPALAIAATVAWAQSSPDPQQFARSIEAAMATAVTQQRASALKQVSTINAKPAASAPTFFTEPWVEPSLPHMMLAGVAPCDPLPTEQLEPLITQAAQQEGLKPELIRAVISQESGGRPCAVSSRGAQGLM